MCGKLEGCHADCKNNPAHRLLRERLSMCEARVKWRKIPVTLVDQRSKRAIAFYEKVIKVKADVAAYLSLIAFHLHNPPVVMWGAVKGVP